MTEMHAHGVSLEARETVKEAASLWWLFLLTGIAWIIVAWLILRWDYSTVTSISYLFGFLAIAAGVNELFLLAGSSFGWKLFHGILGLLFVAAGVFALFNPFETFSALASLVGLAVWLIMRGRSASTFDPLRQAAARYAAGKIDVAEFQRIERTLAATAAPPTVQPDTPPAPGTA